MLHKLGEQGVGERAQLDLFDDRLGDRIKLAEAEGNMAEAGRLTLAAGTPRFRLVVLDTDPHRASVGVLVVPRGREHEPEFGSDSGRMSLAQGA